MIRISISELIILPSFINKIRALNSLVCSIKEKKAQEKRSAAVWLSLSNTWENF